MMPSFADLESQGQTAVPVGPQDHHIVPPEVQAERDAEGLRIRQNELATLNLSGEDRAALQREIARMTGQKVSYTPATAAKGSAPTFAGLEGQGSDSGGTTFGDLEGNGGVQPDRYTRSQLEADNRRELLEGLFGKASNWTLANIGKAVGGEALSLGDLIASIPAGLIGVGADLGMRARAIGEGKTPKEAGEVGQAANAVVMQNLGSPLHKLAQLAGLGGAEEGQSVTDSLMSRLSSIIEKGGDWVEQHTGGAVTKQDVQSITNVAMMAGGGRGLAAGLEKIVPDTAILQGVKSSPEAIRAAVQERMRQAEPVEAAKAAGDMADESVMAAEGQVQPTKTKLVTSKELTLDPVTGKLDEAVPNFDGEGLPKETNLDTALRKVADGQAFDLTAEERIAYKGWKDAPPEEPLVDSEGKPFRNSQSGAVDPRLLARLAVVGLGAWAGQYFSDDPDKVKNAILGGLVGAFASKFNPIDIAKGAKAALSGDGRMKISLADPAQGRENYTRLNAIDTVNLQEKIEGLVPKLADREAITHALEAGPEAVADLSVKQREAAALVRDVFDEKLWQGVDAGVLHSARDDYVAHLWKNPKNDVGAVERFLQGFRGDGASTATNFAKERTIPTIAEGKALGLEPVTEDISQIVGRYSNSLANTIANKAFVDTLKGTKVRLSDGGDISLVLPADKAPRQYVTFPHRVLTGMKVHPDIVGDLGVMFDASSPGSWMKAASAVSDTVKRFQVSFSLFHAKSLIEAAMRATNPVTVLKQVPGMLKGTSQFLQELKKGSASELVRDSVNDGLMYSVKGAGSEDAGVGFYSTMKWLQGQADSIIPGAGLPIKGMVRLNQVVDTVMWERLHPALKLLTYTEKRSSLMKNSAKTGSPLTKEQAGKIAAQFSNDLLGGLNYRKIAQEAATRFGRQLAETAFTPSGRRGLQLAFFAPDWNIAAIRTVANTMGKGSGISGTAFPKTSADLYRNLVARSALYYFVAFNALNLALSGHNIWENKDWTKIDLDPKGDRHLQIDKGMMEVPNMIRHPQQEALNKLGFVPRETIAQTFGVEYASPRVDRQGNVSAGPAMKSGRLTHLAKNVLPFSANQGRSAIGPVENAATALGLVQITGMTPEQKAKAKAEEKAAKLRATK